MTRTRLLIGVVLIAALVLAGAIVVRRIDGSAVMRTITLSATAVAVDEQAGYVVVAGNDQHGGHLTVLDARTGAIIRTVSVRGSGGWCILALDERLGRAFVTFLDYYGHPADLNMVDTRHGTLLRTLTSKPPTVVLAVDERAGRVIVVTSSYATPWVPGRVIVLDARSGVVLQAGPIGEASGGVVVDEWHARAFVTSQHTDRLGNPIGPGLVSVLETRSGRVVRTVAVPQGPYRSVVAKRSGRVFILAYSSQSSYIGYVTMLDAQSGRVLRTVTVGAMPRAIAVDEITRRVFIINTGDLSSKGSVSVLDARTGALVHTVVMPDEPETLAVDPRYGHVFVASEHRDRSGDYTGPGSVIMLDARTGQVLHTVKVGNYPNGMAVDERDARVFVATVGAIDPMLQDMPMGSGSVSVLDARRGRLLRTIPVGVAPNAIGVDERAGRAVVLNKGGTIENKAEPGAWSWLPGWLRQRLPFLPQHGKSFRTVPGSLTVIDTTQ